MKRPTRHIKLLLLLIAIVPGFVSCMKAIDHYDKICDYSVRLIYHYNMENASATNQYPRYVKSCEQYIFDDRGILYAKGPITADPCTGEWVSELMLPPGRYSVIAVGNRSAMSRIHDIVGNEPKIGVTRREDMTLTLTDRSTDGKDDGTNYSATGRLYHGYRTFTILPTGPSRVRIDMVHSHLDLMYTIRWKDGNAPNDSNDFYLKLSDVPSEYNLMPEYIYTEPYGPCAEHDPDETAHDPYNSTCLAVRHHITQVKKDVNIVAHRQPSTMFGKTISGQTISYRIRDCGADRTETMVSLHSVSQGQLMKDIHLNDFLNRSNVNLDHTLKQQYHIIFEIDSQTGKVDVFFSKIADWDEGGHLGG